MKKLYYDAGPTMMSFGEAGRFRLDVPKDVPDDLAAILLRKGRLKECHEPGSDLQKPARKQKEE